MNISATDSRPPRRVSIRAKERPTGIQRNGEILGVYVSRDSKARVIFRAALKEVPASISIRKIKEGDFCDNGYESSLPG